MDTDGIREPMSNHFFITGLPRSRTAWLANLLTYGRSYCFHEALRHGEDLKPLFEGVNADYIGDSDCGIPFYTDRILKDFPGAKFVMIERCAKDVQASLEKVFKEDMGEIMGLCLNKLQEFREKISPLVVRFEDLNNLSTLRQIWRHCLSDEPMNLSRTIMLKNFKVEVTNDYINKLKGRRVACLG